MKTKQLRNKLLILDFSGTLSLGAALFASKQNLIKALKQSGLWQLGVNSPDLFWDKIVHPTWQEGSTTPRGYKAIIARQISQWAAHVHDSQIRLEIDQAATKFAERYFDSSPIDPGWKLYIERYLTMSDTLVIVATDHYAEATNHIANQLNKLNINNVSVVPVLNHLFDNQTVFIANSADLGCHKSSYLFWERLRISLAVVIPAQIILIDDFGCNEQDRETYAEQAGVKARINRTRKALSSVFGSQPHIFPFFIPSHSTDQYGAYRKLMIQANEFAHHTLLDD